MQRTKATETLSSTWAKKLEIKAKRQAIMAMEKEMRDAKLQEIEVRIPPFVPTMQIDAHSSGGICTCSRTDRQSPSCAISSPLTCCWIAELNPGEGERTNPRVDGAAVAHCISRTEPQRLARFCVAFP